MGFNIERKNEESERIKKYSDLLSKYLVEKGGREKVLFLLQELLYHMNQICAACEADRLKCALKPLCGPQRPFLTTRIELGFKPEELPQFCLKQYLNTIKNYLSGKIKYSVLKDAKLTLSQFFVVLSEIKTIPVYIPTRDQPDELIKVLFDALKRVIDDILIFKGESHSYIYALNILIHIDMNTRIVTLNPTEDPITSEEELKLIIETLSSVFKVKVKIIEEMYGFWYIDFLVKKLDVERKLTQNELQILRVSREKIEQLSDYASYSIHDNEIHALIDVTSPGKNPRGKRLTAGLIRQFFEIISETRKKLEEIKQE